MALSPGTKLGPYEVVAPLGAGGMGEVYRAKDTRLGRDVAIKVLPADVSVDEERRQRFEREARTISSLNHPNICALYDVGNQDGMEYLVLEYVEGETLEKRLENGPLPTKILLRHGIEIAEALEKAHRNGIIHRDLKPANIMMTKSGAKLLDFGLAKWSTASLLEAETLKTLTGTPGKLTEQGAILGTFRYMAPEQLEGKEVDTRTDLFAFGEVLYEMATGVPAFSGKSKASLIAAILTAEPSPISKLQPVSPAALDQLVRSCLAKDPDDRWQSAHDVKLELKAIEERGGEAKPIQAAPSHWVKWERLAWAVALLSTSAILLWNYNRSAPEASGIVRSSLLPPPGSSYESYNFAVSPDGERLAFVAVGREGKSTLWVRSLSVATAQEFSATEGAMYPFWSPDSRRVGFFADGKLKTVDTGNGAVKILCSAQTGRGGTWNRDGQIVFAPFIIGPLSEVEEGGGEPLPVTKTREGTGEAHRWPFFLPDGKHFLYLVDWSGPADAQSNGIYVGSLGSNASKLVSTDITSNVSYASGRLLYVRDRSLMAQSFDTDRLELSGPAESIVEQELLTDTGFMNSGFSVSQNGTLVFQSAADASSRLIWFDRTGKELSQIPVTGYSFPRVSPDGRRLLVSSDDARNGKYFLRIYDLERGVSTRITDGGSEEESSWSRDGKRIAFITITGNTSYLYDVPADRSSAPQLLVKGTRMRHLDRSPDDHISFLNLERRPSLAIYTPADHQVTQFTSLGAEARFSPDGKWLAYTGLNEIFVQPFPGPGGRIQISNGAGAQAVWSRDGREITYIAPDRKLMSVTFDAQTKSASAPQVLFQTRIIAPTFVSHQYDVAPDGRFLINSLPSSNSAPLTLLDKWTAELKKQ
jgi:serine/threonine protein kinase